MSCFQFFFICYDEDDEEEEDYLLGCEWLHLHGVEWQQMQIWISYVPLQQQLIQLQQINVYNSPKINNENKKKIQQPNPIKNPSNKIEIYNTKDTQSEIKLYNNQKMQKDNKQQIQPPKINPYQQPDSNRIFTTYKRGISSLSVSLHPPKPKFHSREHNILLLKRTIKRNNRHEYELSKERINKSVDSINERGPTNKINVINIMNCSTNTGNAPKLKSNYCKKITLTNVQKYYQFCLKKVKAISDNDFSYLIRKNIHQQNPISTKNKSEQKQVSQVVQNVARPETPSKILKPKQSAPTHVQGCKQLIKSLSFNNCPNSFSKSISLQNNKKQLDKFIELECSNISKLCYKNTQKQKNNSKYKQHQLKGEQLIISPRLRLKQQIPKRNSKSSQYNREYDSRLSNTSEEKRKLGNSRYRSDGKKQFVIDGWQSYDNVIDEAF